MAEQNHTAIAQGSPTIQRLLASLNEPRRTSSDIFTTPLRPSTSRYRAIAAAPPRHVPAEAVTPADAPITKTSRKRKAGAGLSDLPAKKKRGPKAKYDAGTKATGKKPKIQPDAGTIVKMSKKMIHFPAEVWISIAEFCPPKMVTKLCLAHRSINEALKYYPKQVHSNQILETFPEGMPSRLGNLTEKQFSNLLGGGKGCLAPGCKHAKAEKTYWPYLRRWCVDCWKERTVRERTLLQEERYAANTSGPMGNFSASRLLRCIPYGVCDSYGKATRTVADPLPQHHNQKLHKLFERAKYEELKQAWLSSALDEYTRDPRHTDADHIAAKAAYDKQVEQQKQVRESHFQSLEEQNKLFMEQVIKVEECIHATKQGPKDQKKSTREQRKTFFLEKAAADFPAVPLETIETLKCYKSAVRISIAEANPKVWANLKSKIEQELVGKVNGIATGVTSHLSSTTSTRDSTPSTLPEYASNPPPTNSTAPATENHISAPCSTNSYGNLAAPANVNHICATPSYGNLAAPANLNHTCTTPSHGNLTISATENHIFAPSSMHPYYGSSQLGNGPPSAQFARRNALHFNSWSSSENLQSFPPLPSENLPQHLPQGLSYGNPHAAQSQPIAFTEQAQRPFFGYFPPWELGTQPGVFSATPFPHSNAAHQFLRQPLSEDFSNFWQSRSNYQSNNHRSGPL